MMVLKIHTCIEINALLTLFNLYYKTSELLYYKAFNFNNMYNKILHLHRHLVCLEHIVLCNFLKDLQIWKCIAND